MTDPPAPGEVRAKRIVCGAEIPSGGEAKIGDWLLQTERIRVTVRNQPNRLTQLTGGGGTIVDIAIHGESDDIIELLPTLPGEWPDEVTIEAHDGVIRLRATDDPTRAWSYTLDEDGGAIVANGVTGFTLVPNPGTTLIGQWVHAPGGLVLAGDDEPADRGGWLQWNESRLSLGSSRDVMTHRYPQTRVGVFETDASHIEIRVGDALVTRAPTEDSVATHEYPPNADVRAVQAGFEPSPWSPAVDGRVGPLGASGFIDARAFTVDGAPVPFTLTWNGEPHPLPMDGGRAAVGPGIGSGWIESGPKYDPYAMPTVDINGTLEATATLTRATPDDAWIAFGTPASPGPFERRTSVDVLNGLSSLGYDYAILTANDEVAQPVSRDDSPIPSRSGSRAASPSGSVYAWPWSPNDRAAAHGAAPWQDLSADDLLAWMSKAGRRYTAVDAEWLDAVHEPQHAAVVPDLLYVDSLADLNTIAAQYDAGMTMGLVGASTWVHTEGRTREDIERAIMEGRTSPSTGPNLAFQINDLNPGDHRSDWPSSLPDTAVAQLSLTHPGDIEVVQIVGPRGQSLGAWSAAELPVTVELPSVLWALAIARGQEDWAITSPIWLERP